MLCIRSTFPVLLLLVVAGCVVQPPADIPAQVLVPVLYATNRSLDDAEGAPERYSRARGPVSFGSARVALSTRKEGESPFADWTRWQPRPGAVRHRNELLQVSPLDARAFQDLLDARAGAAGARDVLLYVHGFRRGFDIVAMETAAIAYETNLDGIPMFFSWPSSNSVFGYVGDTANIRWAVIDLRETLQYLLSQASVSSVHVIAHSLGAFGLLEALDDLSRDPSARTDKLGEIVLASPDVDAELFRREFLPILRTLDARITLYATDGDVPLQTSHRVNRVLRLGDASSGIFIADGVETVVYSDVVTFLNSHDAHVEIGDVQADLHYLIGERLSASERPTLESATTDEGVYWRAQPYPGRD